MQSSWWARFRQQVGFEYFGAVIQDAKGVVGGGLVAKVDFAADRYFYYLQDGPVLPGDEAQAQQVFGAVLDYLEQRRRAESGIISHLRIEPRWQSLPAYVKGFKTPDFEDRYFEPDHTLCINLSPSEGAILAQMKPKGRYNIKVAQRHNVSIVEDNSPKGLSDFIRIQHSTTRRQQIGKKPASYFQNLLRVMLPDQKISLFFAEYAGRRIATALVLYFGGRATYFYGGSLAIYRSTMAPYLLHFEIMRKAKQRGCLEYDFWGISPQDQPEHRWAGFSNFKRKFGGYDEMRVPKLDLVYDPAAYAEYKQIEG
jgi:lipid II:glycine glycyltransferase (peptidoglycan interpeptide bridge formation enzyme)